MKTIKHTWFDLLVKTWDLGVCSFRLKSFQCHFLCWVSSYRVKTLASITPPLVDIGIGVSRISRSLGQTPSLKKIKIYMKTIFWFIFMHLTHTLLLLYFICSTQIWNLHHLHLLQSPRVSSLVWREYYSRQNSCSKYSACIKS
jgi:hypothetical protein